MSATTQTDKDSTKSQPANSAYTGTVKYGVRETETTAEYAKRILGNGTYHNVCRELLADSQRLLGLSVAQAEKVAIQYQVDLGRYFKDMQAAGIAIGNAGKGKNWDGQVTLKVAVDKVKGHLTHALCIAKLCAMLQDARFYGILSYDTITLSPALTEWLGAKE